MPEREAQVTAGWRGACLVAITFVYFLIFAQFGFLQRLAELGIADAHLKAVMAAMAAGGILVSLLAPRVTRWAEPSWRLRAALLLCAAAALASLWPLSPAGSIATALLIGGSLGLLTVTLVTHLTLWLGSCNRLLKVGVGTGTGYLVCNLPVLFTASPQAQALTAALLCVAGVIFTFGQREEERAANNVQSAISFALVLTGFAALVWLDSAAFFIIQRTPALKAGTWQGTVHLWTNGALHLSAALASAWWLRRRGLSQTLCLAFLALAAACVLLLDPNRVLLASIFYPVGVSLYSVALVAYPSLLAPSVSVAERGRRAGWIYAIAGWGGSAMGIGMGQHLGHIPPVFVLVAGAVVLMPMLIAILRTRRREVLVTAATLLAAWCIHLTLMPHHAPTSQLTTVERGRQIYIGEGCINCHSQYVRPGTSDVLRWGPAQSVDQLRHEHPPLIGNRRQGPDLAEVGSRRSALWLKIHFYNPAQVSHASFMPSYAHLFRGERGDDLVAYLVSLRAADVEVNAHRADEQVWQPSSAARTQASAGTGGRLFHLNCGTCHETEGQTRMQWAAKFTRMPPLFGIDPLLHVPAAGTMDQRRARIEQIVKFGVYGTNMAGHEYLSDGDIASISLWLMQKTAQSNSIQPTIATPGEKP